MVNNSDVMRVKQDIESRTGYRVRLTANKGKKKMTTRIGVIEAAYNSVFTVKLDCDTSKPVTHCRRLSFSYTDVLTRCIDLVFVRGKEAV